MDERDKNATLKLMSPSDKSTNYLTLAIVRFVWTEDGVKNDEDKVKSRYGEWRQTKHNAVGNEMNGEADASFCGRQK